MIIEKTYYSTETEDVNIIIKDAETGVVGIAGDLVSIKLYNEGTGGYLVEFTSSEYTIKEVDAKTAMVVIPRDNITNEGGSSFSVNGIVLVSIDYGIGIANSFFYSPDEFYMYKLKLATDISDRSYNKTIERDIMLISYLERAIKDAMDLNEKNDAVIFYNKAKRIYLAHKTIHYKNEKLT